MVESWVYIIDKLKKEKWAKKGYNLVKNIIKGGRV